ncbi:ABC transporter permease [Rugosimonospora acidiphila]|uniref:ABC transporter permease n=1 Tax=Rugosimonospora acidiphila TaxID=556531 RepID=A0ABP9S3P8_9ACTN
MFSLALRSLRYRVGGFAASFINVFLGAVVLMAFASLFDTAGEAGVPAADHETLTTMGYVIGGWGALIVAFGVAATLNLSVRQRGTEIGLLKSAGATPAQIGRMIVGEAAVVSVVAAVIAIPVAFFAGRALVAALVSSHQIGHATGYHFGVLALGLGLGDTFAAAGIAAFVTARRAAALRTRQAVTSATVERRGLGRKRAIAGAIFAFAGVDCAVLTATVLHDQGFVTEAVAGEACIHSAIALALFSPVLLRLVTAVIGPVVRAFGGVSGHLADLNVRQRTSQAAGVLMPVILFIGLAAGSLYLQRVQNRALAAGHAAQSADEKAVETLNLIIVGMIAVFAAVVLINLAIATTVHRRREFGQQRLIGSTPGQVLRMLSLETVVTVVTGLVFGTVAALAGVVPYSIALAHRVVPDAGWATYLAVAATAVVLTFVATLGAGGRAIERPALDAVAVDA